MAVTQNSYVGNGSTTTYSFTFPYLKASDVKAQLDADVTTAFTLPTATTLQFNTAPSNGAKIKIYRETSDDALTATFYAGSSVKSEDLNDNFTQNLYSTQEISARYLSNLGGTMVGDLTMGEDAEILFEGATDDAYETKLTVADPTADRTVTLPNETGTVITTGSSGVVTSTMITDGTIVDADISNTTITGSKLVNDTITATQIAANAVTASELADNAVDTNAVLDDAVTYAKIQNVTATDRVLGRDSSGAGIIEEIAPAALRTMINVEDGATADQSNAEIRAAVEAASDSNVFTDADHTKLNAIEASADVTDATNVDAAGAVMNSDASTAAMSFVVDEDNFSSDSATKVPTQQSTKAYIASYGTSTHQPLDADLTTLAGMQSGTASILAGGTALTATLTEINTVVDGKGVHTTISDSDAHYPTSGAVVDYVAAQIAPIGGLEVIANKDSFPETQPASGVVISIADAAGIVVNGSGTSTTPDTISSDATVTINNINSSFNSSTVASGVGWLVTSTGSGQIYNYHKANIKESDVVQLSDDINDFNSRYRTATNRTADGDASNDDGDLFYDQSTNKMYVHDGSAWGEVTSVGDYKLLTIEDTDGSAFDGTNQSFNLKDGSSAASITSAGQLIVSVNGVIQKPNAGTSAPAEGFAMVDGDTIIFSNAPGAGASVFVTQIGSATTVNTPATNSVAEATIQTNVVSEEKLKVSNGPTNGYFLQAQSGASGGLTWAEADTTTIPVADESTDTSCNVVFVTAATGSLPPKTGTNLTFNSNTGQLSATSYAGDGSALTGVASSSANGTMYKNTLSITDAHTIAATEGAHSVGPISVGNTVTVSGRWVIS